MALAESHPAKAVELIAALSGSPVAVCTHGAVIPEILRWLGGQGVAMPASPRWEKASVWLLHTQGARIADVSYLEPPG